MAIMGVPMDSLIPDEPVSGEAAELVPPPPGGVVDEGIDTALKNAYQALDLLHQAFTVRAALMLKERDEAIRTLTAERDEAQRIVMAVQQVLITLKEDKQ
jgi:hypothetical protein